MFWAFFSVCDVCILLYIYTGLRCCSTDGVLLYKGTMRIWSANLLVVDQ